MRKVVPVLLVLGAAGIGAFALSQRSTSEAAQGNQEVSQADVVGDTITGEILIDAKDDVSEADLDELAAIAGTSLRPNSELSSDDKFEVADVDPANEDAILARLSADPRVEHAEPMAVYRASFVPDDPLYSSKQWHLKRVGAESAWDESCGMGVTVAVVDTGIACFDKGPFTKGSDLQGTRCEGGFNFVDKKAPGYDDQGHGTHVAGTIAQTTNNGKGTAGLAYCATLMPVKVLNKSGFGTTANVAEGIRFAADHGAQVINLSLGGPIKSDILEAAVKHAHDKGVVIVAAAGNSGRSVGYPAAYPDVIAVSATDSNDNIASFSSRGPEVAIGAPGVNVTQQTICNGGRDKCEIFGTFNGTSMASPHVAGAAAMVVGMGITDPDAVRSKLQSTANPKSEKNLYGAGILRVDSAVSSTLLSHMLLRGLALLALLALVAKRIKSQKGELLKGKAMMLGALVGGFGLLPFLPFTGLLARMGDWRIAGEILMRPLGELDLVLGAGLHRFLPLANAAPAVVAALLMFGSKRLRPWVGGLALGSAAVCSQIAFSGDVAFFAGGLALRVWMVVNVLACAWIARLALDKRG